MTALRDGSKVVEVTAVDPASALVALVARLQHDLALGLDPRRCGGARRTRDEASAARRSLVEAVLDVLAPENYDGTAVVGTVKRAKASSSGAGTCRGRTATSSRRARPCRS